MASKAFLASMKGRSIRILVSPTPVSFAERRSVLQAIQQHGPVEFFRMTPAYHANFMSITKDEATARRLVARSPLTYSIPASRDYRGSSLPKLEDKDDKPLDLTSSMPDADVEPEQIDSDSKSFTLEIFPQPDYHHHYAVTTLPLRQSWPAIYEHDQSFVTTTLQQSLPRTMAAKGLAYWFLDHDYGRAPQMSRTKRVEMGRWIPGKMVNYRERNDSVSANRESA